MFKNKKEYLENLKKSKELFNKYNPPVEIKKDPVEELKIVIINELKKLLDPVLDKMTYFIGKFSKKVRKEYWLNSGHKYLWGLIKFIKDDFSAGGGNDTLRQEDLDKFIKDSLTKRI